MCEILIKVNCPHCQSSKVVKNGKKKNGSQNLLWLSCRKQFLAHYQNKGACPVIKQLIIKLLERNHGIQDIENVLEIRRRCVLNTLLKQGNNLSLKPALAYYRSVQIDEGWSYGGKRNKVLVVLCHSPEHDQILAYVCGSRSAKTVGQLLKKLKKTEIEEYCTDYWKAFSKVLPAEKHQVGKDYTKNMEGVNNCLRT